MSECTSRLAIGCLGCVQVQRVNGPPGACYFRSTMMCQEICHCHRISTGNSPKFHRTFPGTDLLIVVHNLTCYRFKKWTLSQIPACYPQSFPICTVKGNMDKATCWFWALRGAWTVLGSQSGLAEFISTSTLWHSLHVYCCGEVAAECIESLALVNNSPRGNLAAGQLENAETVSQSINSRSQSDLLCIL